MSKIKAKVQIGGKLHKVSEIDMAGIVYYFIGNGEETKHAWWRNPFSSGTMGNPSGKLSPEDTIEEKLQAKLFIYLDNKKIEVY